MVFGMSLSTYTAIHVVISLIGIVSGLIMLLGWVLGKLSEKWITLFLVTTILTSLTGYGFPVAHLMPSHIVGIISLVALAIALPARYKASSGGAWRWIFVVTCTFALYLNCFVFVVQSFEKSPALHALAPTQKEPPFLIAQVILMVIFIVLGFLAVQKYHPHPQR